MKKIVCTISILGALALASHAAEAKQNWDENCSKCHGPDGKGKTKMGQKSGARDYTDPKVQASFTDDQAFKAIKEGVKEGGKEKMKAYGDKLSDQEIKDLVALIRGFKK